MAKPNIRLHKLNNPHNHTNEDTDNTLRSLHSDTMNKVERLAIKQVLRYNPISPDDSLTDEDYLYDHWKD